MLVRILASLLVYSLAGGALGREVTVKVDAASGPWSSDVNAKVMPFGTGDAKPATIVPFDLGAGKIGIYASGTTGVPGNASVPPIGIDGDAVDDKVFKRKRYPSFYTPKLLYPANRHALVAAFIDDRGIVLGRPFVVGEGVRVPIPENAAGVSLGFNDAKSAGNVGTLDVILDIPD